MVTRYVWYFRNTLKKIWVRVVGIALLGVASLGIAQLFAGQVPESFATRIGSQVVEDLLGILATSMLAVTTFSLSIAVSAFATAAGNATPRAAALLQEDHTTQNVLATFLGAFAFSLLGLISLHAGFYDDSARVVLFAFTVTVIGWVIVALIRWTNHLMEFGRMEDTLARVEAAARKSLQAHQQNPCWGGKRLQGTAPEGQSVKFVSTGYIQLIDMHALQEVAERAGVDLYVEQLPGAFVWPGQRLLSVGGGQLGDEECAEVQKAAVIGDRRTFDEDPRFGLIVLAEIASRALSPGVNDPGTAIDVLGRFVRLLSGWKPDPDPGVRFPNVYVPAVAVADMIEDAFRPLARDGASLLEVQIRLLKSLAALKSQSPETFAVPIDRMGYYLLDQAETAGLAASDLAVIKAVWREQLADISP